MLAALAQAPDPLYPPDGALIRVSICGRPDPATVAIARHITESGSVFPSCRTAG